MDSKVYKLANVADITTGFPFDGHLYSKEGVKVVRGDNVSIGRLRWDKDKVKCWNRPFDQREKYSLHKDDIVIGMDGSRVGKNRAIVAEGDLPLLIAQRVACVRHKEGVDQLYLYYQIINERFEKYIDIICTGSAVPHISLKQIGAFTIYLPTLVEQQQCSNFLNLVDSKIKVCEKINQELESTLKDIYDYWFVQFDFPNEEGKPYKSSGGEMVWNKKLKMEIPKGWVNGNLSNIANIIMGQSPDGSSYNESGEGMIFYQGSSDFGEWFPSIRKYTTEPNRLANKNDILMSVRAPVGALNIANNDCCIGRGLAALTSKFDCQSYLYCVLEDFKKKFDQKSKTGTTFGAITKDELHGLQVIIPNDSIIEKFKVISNPIFEKQMIIGNEINELKELRDFLLPMLMNGQIKIKD